MKVDKIVKIKEIGTRIRAVREKQGLSLKAAAKKLDIGFPTLVRYEKGENSPTADVLRRLLDQAPFVDPGWLLDGKGEMVPDSDNSVAHLNSYIFDDGDFRSEELGSRLNNVMVGLSQVPDNVRIWECREILKWASKAAVGIIGQAQSSQDNEDSLSNAINEIYSLLYEKGVIDSETMKKKSKEKPVRGRRKITL